MRTGVKILTLIGLSLILIISVAPETRSDGPGMATIPKFHMTDTMVPALPSATVSGVIRHNSNPVSGVTVDVVWQGNSQSITTGTDGAYSVSGVPVGSGVRIYVYPPVALRLAFRAWETGPISGGLIKDFDLVIGYRLQAEFHAPDGSPVDPSSILLRPIALTLPSGEMIPPSQTGSQMDMVLAPAFYALNDKRPNESSYFMPPTILDLRSSDLQDQVITLLNRPISYPKTSPVASLITVSEPDVEGHVTVSGTVGSVPPSVVVMVLNQSAANLAMTVSGASGTFSVDLYAPDGSWLLVKYDPKGEILSSLWERASDTDKETAFATGQSVQNLPGVSLRTGGLPAGGMGWQDFTAVGRQGWWGAWAMEGTLVTPSTQGLNVLPGDTLTVTAHVNVHSPALHCNGTPTYTLFGGTALLPLFAGSGRPMPWGTWYTTHLFTPTGLPIEHESPTESQDLGSFGYDNLTCLSEHAIGADLHITVTLPTTLTEGIYRLNLAVLGDIPPDPNTLSIPVWHHDFENAHLPPIRVGDAAPPHIPWYLLLNNPVDGNRGVQALEDAGDFALPNRVRTAPSILVLPRLDQHTGQPIPYRLEPGTYWISGNDRRTPNPPHIALNPPSGVLTLHIHKPDGSEETVGPAPLLQTDIRTPSLADGSDLDESTGYMCDIFHLTTLEDEFAYTFDQDGLYTIALAGYVDDIYGNPYEFDSTFEMLAARVLDLDPAQLPGMSYRQGAAFAPGLHIYPPVPAHVELHLSHLPNSDPALEITHTITGEANRFGYFQPPVGTEIHFDTPGEFRVDILATYTSPADELWAGAVTWGGVVEGTGSRTEAHGRRGTNFAGNSLDDTPTWFVTADLPPDKLGIEHWVPYFSGDIAWGAEAGAQIMEDQSLMSIVTIRDLTGPSEQMYNLIRTYYSRCRDPFSPPPVDSSPAGLEKLLDVGEAPLCVATSSGIDAEADPGQVEYWGYWYAASERPDVHVREIIAEDGVGTAYWRFNDTYGYQIGEPADGDQEGDIKWNFGGTVMRVISETNPVNEYAIYASFWVLLPLDDPVGPRVAPPFQDATGASLNGGPILSLLGEEIDMLFLPKGVRPGDVLELGQAASFSGHVGPPLDSQVSVTLTPPSGAVNARSRSWHANKIGWLYDPTFDFIADEVGRWTVDVSVLHDRPYIGNGVTPTSHNTGTVLGSSGQYAFYVVNPDSPALYISAPLPGFIIWPNYEVEPVQILGRAPAGTTAVYYTIHDKGIVMDQGALTPQANGTFALVYDAETLHDDFPMLSLIAREGRWEGLADEVSISLLAVGTEAPRAATVTLISEEVFIQGGEDPGELFLIFMPLVTRH